MLLNQEQLPCVWVMQYILYATPARHMIQSPRYHIHHAPTAPINTLPVDTTALLKTQNAKFVGKRVTGKQNATALAPLVCKCPIIIPGSRVMKRGENHKLLKPKQRKDLCTKTCSLLYWTVKTVGDVHPKELSIDNISSQWCNKAYTVIKLPASTSSKGTISVHVKVDTRSGGNILPFHLFQQLHPKQTSTDSLPIGLDPIQTKLTAYNGSLIPLYGILCAPILWQPNIPGAQPCMIHSYWYIADTPGPALLGLPACERLAVVQVNCAFMTTQTNRSLTGTAPTSGSKRSKTTHSKNTKAQVHQIH